MSVMLILETIDHVLVRPYCIILAWFNLQFFHASLLLSISCSHSLFLVSVPVKNTPQKLIPSTNVKKSHLHKIYFSVTYWFWNFALIQPYCLQNCKMSRQIKWMSWKNIMSQHDSENSLVRISNIATSPCLPAILSPGSSWSVLLQPPLWTAHDICHRELNGSLNAVVALPGYVLSAVLQNSLDSAYSNSLFIQACYVAFHGTIFHLLFC